MAKFCKYCGKELVEGKCDCEGFKAAEAAAANVTAEAPQAEAPKAAEAPAQEIPVVEGQVVKSTQSVQEKAAAAAAATGAAVAGAVNAVQEKTGVNFAELFGNIWKLFVLGFTKPLTAVKEAEKKENHLSAFVFGGIYLLIIFFTFLIHVPFVRSFKVFGAGERASFGWWLLFMVAVAVLINALFTWVFTKKHTQDLTFVTALAGGCMANVYPCTAFVAAFILGMFAPGIATLVLMVSMMIWCTIMTINVQRLLAGAEDDKRVWIAFVYTLICGAITAVSGIVVLSSMIAAAVDSISDSLGMFLY